MENKIVMAVSELEDGREHIHAKKNRPEKYDLGNVKDLKILDEYYKRFIKNKTMCYSKDLTSIYSTEDTPKNERLMVKDMRYEPYDEDLHIPYRTFSVLYDPKRGKPQLAPGEIEHIIQDRIDKERNNGESN